MPLSAPLLHPRLIPPPANPRYAATVSLLARATEVDCFAVLTDFDSYPRWSSLVKRCEVAARSRDGLARHVDFELEIARRRIRYRLAFHYVPPRRASWALIGGDVAGIAGSYHFEQAAGGVVVSCTQAVDVGFWIPELIRRPLEQRALRRSVEEFRAAVETHASGWA
jgi:hypothetical protein